MAGLTGTGLLARTLNLNSCRKLLFKTLHSSQNCLAAWNGDWKSYLYLETSEEQAAAAKKYGLRLEDYQPHDPDKDPGYGDYPDLKWIGKEGPNRYDHFYYYHLGYNYGAPIHKHVLKSTGNRYNLEWEKKACYSNDAMAELMLHEKILKGPRHRSLKGKTVLVTGASSGLGEALSHCFAVNGCRVILTARNKENLNKVKSAIQENYAIAPDQLIVFQLDLENHSSIPEVAKSILQFCGPIDILVNNAGVLCHDYIAKTNIDMYKKTMDVNFFGAIALTKEILPSMVDNGGGTVVAVSSLLGLFSKLKSSSYSASKHALQAFFDSLRAENHTKGIHVFVPSVGYVKTNMSFNGYSGDGTQRKFHSRGVIDGMDVEKCSNVILKGIVGKKNESIIAPISLFLLAKLRHLWPDVYHYFIRDRKF